MTFLQPSSQPEWLQVCDQLLPSQTASNSQPHPRPGQAPTLLDVVTQLWPAHGKFQKMALFPLMSSSSCPSPEVFFLEGDARCPPQKVLEGSPREDPRI